MTNDDFTVTTICASQAEADELAGTWRAVGIDCNVIQTPDGEVAVVRGTFKGLTTCPFTGKRRWDQRSQAKAALREYENSPGWQPRPGTRPYHCTGLCNGWHLTSQPPYRGSGPRSAR
jgi:hypothetical protein